MSTPRDPTTLDRPGDPIPDGRADRVEVYDDTRRPTGSGGSGIAIALIVALALILLLFFLF